MFSHLDYEPRHVIVDDFNFKYLKAKLSYIYHTPMTDIEVAELCRMLMIEITPNKTVIAPHREQYNASPLMQILDLTPSRAFKAFFGKYPTTVSTLLFDGTSLLEKLKLRFYGTATGEKVKGVYQYKHGNDSNGEMREKIEIELNLMEMYLLFVLGVHFHKYSVPTATATGTWQYNLLASLNDTSNLDHLNIEILLPNYNSPATYFRNLEISKFIKHYVFTVMHPTSIRTPLILPETLNSRFANTFCMLDGQIQKAMQALEAKMLEAPQQVFQHIMPSETHEFIESGLHNSVQGSLNQLEAKLTIGFTGEITVEGNDTVTTQIIYLCNYIFLNERLKTECDYHAISILAAKPKYEAKEHTGKILANSCIQEWAAYTLQTGDVDAEIAMMVENIINPSPNTLKVPGDAENKIGSISYPIPEVQLWKKHITDNELRVLRDKLAAILIAKKSKCKDDGSVVNNFLMDAPSSNEVEIKHSPTEAQSFPVLAGKNLLESLQTYIANYKFYIKLFPVYEKRLGSLSDQMDTCNGNHFVTAICVDATKFSLITDGPAQQAQIDTFHVAGIGVIPRKFMHGDSDRIPRLGFSTPKFNANLHDKSQLIPEDIFHAKLDYIQAVNKAQYYDIEVIEVLDNVFNIMQRNPETRHHVTSRIGVMPGQTEEIIKNTLAERANLFTASLKKYLRQNYRLSDAEIEQDCLFRIAMYKFEVKFKDSRMSLLETLNSINSVVLRRIKLSETSIHNQAVLIIDSKPLPLNQACRSEKEYIQQQVWSTLGDIFTIYVNINSKSSLHDALALTLRFKQEGRSLDQLYYLMLENAAWKMITYLEMKKHFDASIPDEAQQDAIAKDRLTHTKLPQRTPAIAQPVTPQGAGIATPKQPNVAAPKPSAAINALPAALLPPPTQAVPAPKQASPKEEKKRSASASGQGIFSAEKNAQKPAASKKQRSAKK